MIPGWEIKWSPFCDSGPEGEYFNYHRIRALEVPEGVPRTFPFALPFLLFFHQRSGCVFVFAFLKSSSLSVFRLHADEMPERTPCSRNMRWCTLMSAMTPCCRTFCSPLPYNPCDPSGFKLHVGLVHKLSPSCPQTLVSVLGTSPVEGRCPCFLSTCALRTVDPVSLLSHMFF